MGLFIWYATFTNEIFGQLLSNFSRYAANLNMKADSFFTYPVQKFSWDSSFAQKFTWEYIGLVKDLLQFNSKANTREIGEGE